MEDRPKVRLFVESPLAEGQLVPLSDPQSHYLLHVMRGKAGMAVALFNGRDGEWRAEIEMAGKRAAVAHCRALQRPQTPPADLWLVFAPVKRACLDLIVEKATELGVTALLPVQTQNTVIERMNPDRLRAITIEAAEQCERLDLPLLQPLQPLSRLLAEWPAERRLFHLDETGGGRPIAAALTETPPGPAALLVGPEGGFAQSELDALRRFAFASGVGLGARILRAETAVIAALACYQALRGDWQSPS